jgi:hypothetical protein
LEAQESFLQQIELEINAQTQKIKQNIFGQIKLGKTSKGKISERGYFYYFRAQKINYFYMKISERGYFYYSELKR